MSVRRSLSTVVSFAAVLMALGCSDGAPLKRLFNAGGAETEVPMHIVPLGGTLSAMLPNDPNWSCAHEGSLTMHIHSSAKGAADVLVIAESSHPVLRSTRRTRRISGIARELDTFYMVERQFPLDLRERIEKCVESYEALHERNDESAETSQKSVADVSPSEDAVDPWAGLKTSPSDASSPPHSNMPQNASGESRQVNRPESSSNVEPANPEKLLPDDDLLAHCIEEVTRVKKGAVGRYIRQLMFSLSSRTMGQGLGFSPEQGGFLGWTDVGSLKAGENHLGVRNAAIKYRVGSRTGRWALPSHNGSGGSKSKDVPALHILAHLTPVFDDGRRGRTPTYVTVLCQSSGENCNQSDALLKLFTSMHSTSDSSISERACTGGSIADFASAYGLTVLSDAQWGETYEEF